ncbi:MAG TPA: DUF72 domain-containing protein [Acidimicrobiales bacterium]|nr:DUF72 domain-containing protein [Acidimicrobiales bacterium]
MILIGTSGWQYKDWRGTFYPSDVPQSRWLEFYAGHFQTQEVNNAFYRLPSPETFRAWRDRTPDDFVMVVKASRYLTHVKRLRDPEEPVRRLMANAGALGPKLGAVLVQLPPTLTYERFPELEQTLACFPRSVRVAVEFRHDSWWRDETYDLLRRFDAACCLPDSPRRSAPLVRTAGWGYVRMHEGVASPRPCYGEKALDSWAQRVASLYPDGEDVFVFFNNDPHACAVRDARLFALACRRHGLAHTRVPGPHDIHVLVTPTRT